MNKVFENFKKYILPFGLNDADFDQLVNYCSIVHFQKGEVVMEAGVKQNAIYFIYKGIIRN